MLADALEEINIQVVNEVGIDINLVCEHEHMHSMLQFVSGLGQRKAKKIISKMKSMGTKLISRGQLQQKGLIGHCVLFQTAGFINVRVPEEDLNPALSNETIEINILDQTRIHMENYKTARYYADQIMNIDPPVEKSGKFFQDHYQQILKEIICNPSKLKSLPSHTIKLIEEKGDGMKHVIEKVLKELGKPFGDPREYRSERRPSLTKEELFYLLIEESKRTFKVGQIVTATVIKVLKSIALCRLDNGLTAIAKECDFVNDNKNEKLNEKVNKG